MIQSDLMRLVRYGEKFLSVHPADETYLYNRLLYLLHLEDGRLPEDFDGTIDVDLPDTLLQPILSYALENGIITEGQEESFSDLLMDVVSLRPSEVAEIFRSVLESDGAYSATEWFYRYCVHNNYIKKSAIDRNLRWDGTGDGKGLVITVNLSKPEKDNKKIAADAKKKSTSYPACSICAENEGYNGHGQIRNTLRTVPLQLNGTDFFLQYSPYAYFDRHAIIINREHTPMRINEETVRRLLDFVDLYPFYFIGSNAALPRIGGSLLSHDHYQGGFEKMPMQRAQYREVVSENGAKVKIGILEWFNSAFRFESKDKKALGDAVIRVIDSWKNFSDERFEILAETDEPHNSASPIARKEGETYIVDLILRNNRYNERHPDGIFHAHKEYHNIKSEGIGLIEAMGLFILPPRLNRQLFGTVKEYLTGKETYVADALTEDMKIHRAFIEQLLRDYPNPLSDEQAEQAIRDAVSSVCGKILNNTAVFPNTPEGNAAMKSLL